MSVNGWIIVNKPAGMTSTSVGSLVKRLSRSKSLGHIGTLDPFATGVLPLAVGEATKIIPHIDTSIKEYECELCFGQATDTGDLEGRLQETHDHRPTIEEIEKVLPQFLGEITQIPPAYSAVWVNGERAYTLARQGITPVLRARPVTIYKLKVIDCLWPERVRLQVECSAGTYIRTLGQDIAKALGTVGCLTALQRTRVGKFNLSSSFSLDNLKEEGHISSISSCVLPIRAVLDDIPAVPVSVVQELKIRQGQAIDMLPSLFPEETLCLMVKGNIEIGLGRYSAGQLFPIRIFNFSK